MSFMHCKCEFKTRFEKEGVGCFAIFLAPFIVYMFILSNEKSSVFFGTLGWVLIIVFIVFAINNSTNNGDKEKKYNVERGQYPKIVNDWQEQCANLQMEYELAVKQKEVDYTLQLNNYNAQSISSYNDELANFEKYLESNQADEQIHLRKTEKLSQFISTRVSKAQVYQHMQIPLRGVTEQNFFEKLHKSWFEECACLNKTVPGSKYLPDITIGYPAGEDKLYVDIEIDEPYVGATGKPIHYIDGSDSQRDEFFLKHGWIVIRFAEEQVVKNIDECFWFTLRTLERCINFRRQHWWLSHLEESYFNVPLVKQWTKDEAHAMAFRRYRNTYLGRELTEKLSIEEAKKEPEPYNMPFSKGNADEYGDLPF